MINRETLEILVLAVSEKHCGYCVAGLNLATYNLENKHKPEWIRLIGNHESFELTKNEIVYMSHENIEKTCKPLDIIKVKAIKMTPYIHKSLLNEYKKYEEESMFCIQPENYVVAGKFEFVDEISVNKFLRNVTLDNNKYIFGNRKKCLSPEDAIMNNMSLTIVKVENLRLFPKMKYWKNEYYSRYRASFYYNGQYYDDISVTDPDYIVNSQDQNPEELEFCNDTYLVVSLGEYFNGYHYKIIAKIFDN